ncbi:hypothetical protein [Neptunomonas antarctica]|uniref:Uncharacterized protein n=1 Tax=Neptunomonas antarctica TaxID=619304 RepID=A0A1N7PPZ3_9GAMM|nr:hypothetical protein [Neptunomonas antarctica]SIT12499.1 hypothetical protein SAMN05421760_1185 [Neptunomonas antarctica]
MRKTFNLNGKNLIFMSYFLVFLGVLTPMLVLFSIVEPPKGEPPHIWFQRSGSLLVIFAIVAESILLQGNENFKNLKVAWKTSYSVAKILSPILAIIGTMIWGYGDIPLT